MQFYVRMGTTKPKVTTQVIASIRHFVYPWHFAMSRVPDVRARFEERPVIVETSSHKTETSLTTVLRPGELAPSRVQIYTHLYCSHRVFLGSFVGISAVTEGALTLQSTAGLH